MTRDQQIGIPVNKKEKKLIQANAKLNKYSSVAAFLRDRGLDIDISNKASLAIILTYLSSHMKDLSQDGALNWTKRKNDIKHKLAPELIGMNKFQRGKYLDKLEHTLDAAKEIQNELADILAARFIEE